MSERLALSLSLCDTQISHTIDQWEHIINKSTIHQTAAHLEAFCLLCGDLALLGPLSLEAEGEDERPLLQELLRCRRFALLPTLLADVCPGDADVLRWRA